MKTSTKNQAVKELIFAGALWGFGFVATRWALDDFSASETMVYRFLVAFFAGETLRFLLTKLPHQPSFSLPPLKELKVSITGGLILGGMLLVQTIGLKYTTATKSGFITTLYVVLVPLIQHLIFKIKTPWKFYAYVALALFGTWLLVGAKLESLNQGDLWTLGCSLLAALHILYIGYTAPQVEAPLRFNNYQSLGCLILALPFALSQGEIKMEASWLPWLGILFLGTGSSVIAFMIQIRSQRVLEPSTASMLFLLESPFAFVFGWLLLGETLTWIPALGAILILLSSYLTILLERTSQTK